MTSIRSGSGELRFPAAVSRGTATQRCIHERFERPVPGAAFPHINLVVANQNLCINDGSAHWTYAARKLVEDIIGVVLHRLGTG